MFHDMFLINSRVLSYFRTLMYFSYPCYCPFYLTLFSNVNDKGIAQIIFFIAYSRSGTNPSLQLAVVFRDVK